jgi:hypothetical protein
MTRESHFINTRFSGVSKVEATGNRFNGFPPAGKRMLNQVTHVRPFLFSRLAALGLGHAGT